LHHLIQAGVGWILFWIHNVWDQSLLLLLWVILFLLLAWLGSFYRFFAVVGFTPWGSFYLQIFLGRAWGRFFLVKSSEVLIFSLQLFQVMLQVLDAFTNSFWWLLWLTIGVHTASSQVDYRLGVLDRMLFLGCLAVAVVLNSGCVVDAARSFHLLNGAGLSRRWNTLLLMGGLSLLYFALWRSAGFIDGHRLGLNRLMAVRHDYWLLGACGDYDWAWGSVADNFENVWILFIERLRWEADLWLRFWRACWIQGVQLWLELGELAFKLRSGAFGWVPGFFGWSSLGIVGGATVALGGRNFNQFFHNLNL